MDDYVTEVIKIQGEFTWHSHADTDELFFVVEGELTIQLRHGDVSVGAGSCLWCPVEWKAARSPRVRFRPVLVEPSGVVNTGDAGGPLTAKYDDSPRRVSAPYR